MHKIGGAPYGDRYVTIEPSATQLPAPERSYRSIKLLLLIVAVVEVVGSFTNLLVLFDGDPSIPGTSAGGLAITATILLAPAVAVAALIFAVQGALIPAIVTVAMLGLLDWLSFVPSIKQPSELFPSPDFAGAHAIVQMIVLPLLAVAAIVLAWRGERLALAATFAILPTLVNLLGVVAFAIGVGIYGF